MKTCLIIKCNPRLNYEEGAAISSISAANDKIKKRMFNPNLSTKRENLPDSVTRDEVKCKKCGFKARYQFIRCPECNELQNPAP